MYTQEWETSQRQYDIEKREDVGIPVDGGDIRLAADIFLPADKDDPSPVIVGAHNYNKEFQTDAPVEHWPIDPSKGWIESGDPNFYVRRGYAMVNLTVRGIGKSDGTYRYGGERETRDICEAIEWLADQAWCNGRVGMFGVSYYAVKQQQVAGMNPDSLECIFAPFAWADWYRDMAYHGGILAKGWVSGWPQAMDNLRGHCHTKQDLSTEEFQAAIDQALADEEIFAASGIVNALQNPEEPANSQIVDAVLHSFDDEFWAEREVDWENTDVPAFLGADWGIYGFHLPGAFRSWRNWQGPKRMVIGPPVYLDRPLYQYHYESLRWFDHWLKDVETGIMDEPPVRLFVTSERDEEGRPVGEWKAVDDWPVPGTRWTPFYLHEDDLLSEHEIFSGTGSEGYDSFTDSPFDHGSLWYETPPIVEPTEICGPILLNLYASTTAAEELFFVTLYDVDREGNRDEITRGWLRGSHRAVDENASDPWRKVHPHDEREPLTPGEVHEFNVNLVSNARRFPPGHRIGIRIKCSDADDDRVDSNRGFAVNHLETQSASRIKVHRNNEHPSHLLLPVTEGNIIGTYMSGGVLGEPPVGPMPVGKIKQPKSLDKNEE